LMYSDQLIGGLLVTTAFSALSEVETPVRFVNVVFGIWHLACCSATVS
jgi:hypothetical protein